MAIPHLKKILDRKPFFPKLREELHNIAVQRQDKNLTNFAERDFELYIRRSMGEVYTTLAYEYDITPIRVAQIVDKVGLILELIVAKKNRSIT